MELLAVVVIVFAAGFFVAKRLWRAVRSAQNNAPASQAGCPGGCCGKPAAPKLVALGKRPVAGSARLAGNWRASTGLALLLSLGAWLAPGAVVHAADTVEAFDVGASDVDFYLGFDGINGAEGSSFGDLMLGYGLTHGLSAYLGATLAGNKHLAEGSSTLYLGIFATPIDTAHVDLDVLLQLASGGGEFQVAPGFELNFDGDPQMRSWGVYLRSALGIYGHQVPAAGSDTRMLDRTSYHVDATLGVYRTVAARHQLLVEYHVDLHPTPASEARRVDAGGVRLGYNVLVSDALELVTQIHMDVPQGNETVAFGIMTGFVATLPSAAGLGNASQHSEALTVSRGGAPDAVPARDRATRSP